MKAWSNKGLPLQELPQVSVRQLSEETNSLQLLDVRSESEFQNGRIADAQHRFVAEMREGVNGELQINRDQPVAVYCGSGYRASIAASIMQREGFEKVRNVPGSMQAWKTAGFPIQK